MQETRDDFKKRLLAKFDGICVSGKVILLVVPEGGDVPLQLSDIIREKHEWIGGTLRDQGDPRDRVIRREDIPMTTNITDITLEQNYFLVVGEDFECGGHTDYLGVDSSWDWPDDGVSLHGYGNHRFEIFRHGVDPDAEEDWDLDEEDEEE